MDTYAAIRRLQAHGLTLEQAEDITAVIQEAVALGPSTVELRTFVLEHEVKLERFRAEMHQEFGCVLAEMHQEFGRIQSTLAGIMAELTALRERRAP